MSAWRLLHWQGSARTLHLLESGGQRIAAVGVGGRWHSHADMEFTIVLRGAGMRYVGDHVGAFGAMDCALLGSRLPHCWMEDGPTDGYELQFHLPPEHPLRRAWAERTSCRSSSPRSQRGLLFHPPIARQALVVLERMAGASRLGRSGLLLELAALLHDAPRQQSAILSQAGAFAEAEVHPRLESVVQWALEQFSGPLTLSDAVRRSAMSRATFCRQFLRHTGKTFVAFVNDARLAVAHQADHSDPARHR